MAFRPSAPQSVRTARALRSHCAGAVRCEPLHCAGAVRFVGMVCYVEKVLFRSSDSPVLSCGTGRLHSPVQRGEHGQTQTRDQIVRQRRHVKGTANRCTSMAPRMCGRRSSDSRTAAHNALSASSCAACVASAASTIRIIFARLKKLGVGCMCQGPVATRGLEG